MFSVRRPVSLMAALLLFVSGLTTTTLPAWAQTPDQVDNPGGSVPAPIPTLPSRPAAIPTLPAPDFRRPALETVEPTPVPSVAPPPPAPAAATPDRSAAAPIPAAPIPAAPTPVPTEVAPTAAGAPPAAAPAGPPLLPTVPPSPTNPPPATPTNEASPTATPAESATATPRPRGPVTVPSVVGRPEAEARRLIEDAGLVNGYVNYQRLEDVTDKDQFLATAPGSVVSQQPGGGQTVDPGTRVLLAVADPADPRPAPSRTATLITATATLTGTVAASPTASATPTASPTAVADDPLAGVEPTPTATASPTPEAELTIDAAGSVTDTEMLRQASADDGPIDPGTPEPLPARIRPAPLTLTLSGPERSQITIPGRLQLDGSPYQRANCGVAALGMILEGSDITYSTASLRALANQIQPPRSYLDGLAWETLTGVAAQFGFQGRGLYSGGSYRRWSFQELRDELIAGRPIITLVHYQTLLANWASTSQVDHYIVLTGYDGSDFIYNDSAPFTGTGIDMRLNAADLQAAWDASSLPRSAMALVSPEGAIGLNPAAVEGQAAELVDEARPDDLVPFDPGQQNIDLGLEPGDLAGAFPVSFQPPSPAAAEGEAAPIAILPAPTEQPVPEQSIEPAGQDATVLVATSASAAGTAEAPVWLGWLLIIGGTLALALAGRQGRAGTGRDSAGVSGL